MAKKSQAEDADYIVSLNNQTYQQFYKNICLKHNVKMNNCILYGLKQTDLSVNVEQLTEADLITLSKLWQCCKFKNIRLFGNVRNSQSIVKMKPKSKRGQMDKKENFINNPMFIQVLQGLQTNLEKFAETQTLVLENIPLQGEWLKCLSQALAKNQGLLELYIINCGLTASGLEILAPGISQNGSLIVLDISSNKLQQNTGRIVGKILSAHCQKRDDIVWMYGLRGEEPEEDISLKGICEVNISNNLIDTPGIRDLCYFLQYDNWTRSINLKNNNISEEGV